MSEFFKKSLSFGTLLSSVLALVNSCQLFFPRKIYDATVNLKENDIYGDVCEFSAINYFNEICLYVLGSQIY